MITVELPDFLKNPNKYNGSEIKGIAGKCEIQAAESDGELPKLDITANTGTPMMLAGFSDPVVVDLKGVEFAKQALPVIADHDAGRRIGHSNQNTIEGGAIRMRGFVSGAGSDAEQFVKESKNGFPHEASIDAVVVQGRFVKAGEKEVVNGQTWEGPMIVSARTRIKGVSVVTWGADENTRALAASHKGESEMSTDIETKRELEAVESQRVHDIRRLCASMNNPEKDGEAIEAVAIREGWDKSKTELECRRAERPKVSQFYGRGSSASSIEDEVLEAGLMLHYNPRMAEQCYSPEVIEAGSKLGIHHLMDVMKIQAQRLGIDCDWRNKNEVIRAAFNGHLQASGGATSTRSLTNLLSNVAGKSIQKAYMAHPSVARRVAKELSGRDFKQHTGIRVTAEATFEDLAPDGTLKHASLSDSTYTYTIGTKGRVLGLDRTDIINDDAGGLDDVPAMFSRGAAVALEKAFWTLVLANTGSFFSSGNGNLISGGSSALSSSGLASLVQKMMEQTDANSDPISAMPEVMVVPPALWDTGQALYISRTLNVGASSASTDSELPAENVHFGKYEPLASPWIGTASSLSSTSDTAFYLFADPENVPAFGIAYLDGQNSPVIEPADPPADQLGLIWRGYFDFGVCQVDHRGAAKSAGA